MAFEQLSSRDQKIVLQCMRAVSVLIDESETHARLGLDREELYAVISEWPNIDDREQTSRGFLAINNSLNEVCHGLNIGEWTSFFDAPPDDVCTTYRNWLRMQNISGGIR